MSRNDSRTKIVLSAVALAAALAGSHSAARAADTAKEKCYGIAKAGHNDCFSATGTHACAMQAKKDMDPNDWVYTPKGTCAMYGGKTSPPSK